MNSIFFDSFLDELEKLALLEAKAMGKKQTVVSKRNNEVNLVRKNSNDQPTERPSTDAGPPIGETIRNEQPVD